MLFSLLIANFNNGVFFKDCYKSIMEQTYNNWEVIIVDDASTDDSLKIIKDTIGDDGRFKLFLNKRNKGCGYTKRECVEFSNGNILAFLDPDDALMPEALSIMVKEHKENGDASIITSKYMTVDGDFNTIEKDSHGSEIPLNKSYLTYRKGAMTHFATFKRDNYFKTPGIDPFMKRAVDQDLYYKLEEQGLHKFLNKVLYKYRLHDEGISQGENKLKAWDWHFYASKKAFKRRRIKNFKVHNFSDSEFEYFSYQYYLGKLERSKGVKNIHHWIYFNIKVLILKSLKNQREV
ncbi:glycosyltransferase family 2 protein [Salegentibacter sp. UBA1130]|uniref:glycosyltransferase family 2 protein n=1 Tax=Salegentibacter sp. UBA1130 TaxID=1947451 RepID=UPI00257ABE82|nr:glycosyltransferase family 2 protein [Salegentibacter sp. UBA1130]